MENTPFSTFAASAPGYGAPPAPPAPPQPGYGAPPAPPSGYGAPPAPLPPGYGAPPAPPQPPSWTWPPSEPHRVQGPLRSLVENTFERDTRIVEALLYQADINALFGVGGEGGLYPFEPTKLADRAKTSPFRIALELPYENLAFDDADVAAVPMRAAVRVSSGEVVTLDFYLPRPAWPGDSTMSARPRAICRMLEQWVSTPDALLPSWLLDPIIRPLRDAIGVDPAEYLQRSGDSVPIDPTRSRLIGEPSIGKSRRGAKRSAPPGSPHAPPSAHQEKMGPDPLDRPSSEARAAASVKPHALRRKSRA
jgi:hypothetical protein